MKKKVTAGQLLALHARGIDTEDLTNKQVYKLVQRQEALSQPTERPNPYKAALKALNASYGRVPITAKITDKAKELTDELKRRMDELDQGIEIEEVPINLQAQP